MRKRSIVILSFDDNPTEITVHRCQVNAVFIASLNVQILKRIAFFRRTHLEIVDVKVPVGIVEVFTRKVCFNVEGKVGVAPSIGKLQCLRIQVVHLCHNVGLWRMKRSTGHAIDAELCILVVDVQFAVKHFVAVFAVNVNILVSVASVVKTRNAAFSRNVGLSFRGQLAVDVNISCQQAELIIIEQLFEIKSVR